MTRNPATLAGRNRTPALRTVRSFTSDELDAIAAELAPSTRRARVRRRNGFAA
jgi:hypothetical protein